MSRRSEFQIYNAHAPAGTQVEKTFRAGEPVSTADISRREGQYTYAEGDEYIFMDQQTFEETRLPKDDWATFLKEGMVWGGGKQVGD